MKAYVSFIASLLNAYDSSWQVDSFPSLIGNTNFSNIIKPSTNTATDVGLSKKDIASLKRWMIVVGVGYLVPTGSSLADPKKFTHLCTTLMDKVEQRHGPRLKPMVRIHFKDI